jgi:hypothetical protein
MAMTVSSSISVKARVFGFIQFRQMTARVQPVGQFSAARVIKNFVFILGRM